MEDGGHAPRERRGELGGAHRSMMANGSARNANVIDAARTTAVSR